MNDTLAYMKQDPLYCARAMQKNLTFSLHYAFTERFRAAALARRSGAREALAGVQDAGHSGAAIAKRAGAAVLAIFAPGKKLLFMGDEFGQWKEWNFDGELDWALLQEPEHRALAESVKASERALSENAGAPCGRGRMGRLRVARLRGCGAQRDHVRAAGKEAERLCGRCIELHPGGVGELLGRSSGGWEVEGGIRFAREEGCDRHGDAGQGGEAADRRGPAAARGDGVDTGGGTKECRSESQGDEE